MNACPDHLEYSFLSTAMGEMLIARTGNGLAASIVGVNQQKLLQELTARFPDTHISQATDGMHAEKTLINAVMQGEQHPASLPLDLHSTPFQLSVWHALMAIAFGSTITYQQLAESVGKPSATRAVASACGANPLAIVVPCHRVIRKNGELGGYRWGLDIKRQLLALEQQVRHQHNLPAASGISADTAGTQAV